METNQIVDNDNTKNIEIKHFCKVCKCLNKDCKGLKVETCWTGCVNFELKTNDENTKIK